MTHKSSATLSKHTRNLPRHGFTYLEDGRAIEVEESHFRAEAIEFIIESEVYYQYARLMPHDLLQRKESVAIKAIASTAGH